MSQRRLVKKVLKDWRETLSDTDGIKTNLEPFWQTQSGKECDVLPQATLRRVESRMKAQRGIQGRTRTLKGIYRF